MLAREPIEGARCPAGDALYVARLDGLTGAEISRVELRTGARTSWRRISPADPGGVVGMQMVMGPDGESYVYSFARALSGLTVVEGWD